MGDDITIGVTEIVNNIEVTAQPNDQIVDISVTDNADNVTLNITPTVVEVNINKGSSFAQWGDLYGTLSDQTDLQNALNLKANLVDGKVPASELPSYVDDIIEVANYAALPATGEIGKIYVTLDNNKIYRWSGSIYIEIASNSAIWGAITGTLTDQTDLVTALNAKQNTITLTTTGTTGAATLVGSTLNIPNYTTDISGLVPYTGATTNVDLGTYKLTASDLVINHASGSGVAASITKGGNGEALTVVKSSGSGNAASITGGTTLISELHLTTDLADDYIASAATWNAKQAALNGTGFVKISGTTISYDNTTYLSGTVAIANGGTGATTADAALTNLGGTTVGKNIFTSANPSPYTSAYLKVKPDNSVEWLEANAFRIAIGAGTGNGTVTSVEAVGSYGGLTLTGTVTGSGQITLGGTPEGNWPINITGNASSVNTVQVSTNADFYLTFADANNGSPTSEFLYTIGTVKVNPSTGALTAGSFVKSGGTSSQFLKADGSIDSTTYQTALTNPVSGTGTTNYLPKFTETSAIGNSLIYDNGTSVGIGTTSPASKLDVNGQVRVTDLTLQGFYQARTSDTVSQGVFGGNSFVLRNGSTSEDLNFDIFNRSTSAWYTPMVIKNTGNVGIGTTSPAAKLTVNTATNENVAIGSLASIPTGRTLILQTSSSGGSIETYSSVTSGYVNTLINPNGGNVGIGTTSPTSPLHVKGSGAYAGVIVDNTGTTGGGYFAARQNGSQVGIVGVSGAIIGDTSSNMALFSETGKSVDFMTDGSATIKMRITSGGNVGIGTTSPLTALTVSGNLSLFTTNQIRLYNSAKNNWAEMSSPLLGGDTEIDFKLVTKSGIVYVNPTGNVGIGTTSPSARLHTYLADGANDNVLKIQQGTNAYASGINIIANNDGGAVYNFINSQTNGGTEHWRIGGGATASTMTISTGGSERMRITSGGNVGIGTSSPSTKTHIVGSASTGGVLRIENDQNQGDVNHGIINLVNTASYGIGNDASIMFSAKDSSGTIHPRASIGMKVSSSSTSGDLVFNTRNNSSYGERMRITSGGAINIKDGTLTGGGGFEFTSEAGYGARFQSGAYKFMSANNSTTYMTITSSGVTATAGFFNSDMRLKDLTDYDYNVSDIKPITYLWKDGRDNKKHVGYSAQEVQKVMPDAVNEDEKGMLSVNYVEVLVAKIAELENRIKQLEK